MVFGALYCLQGFLSNIIVMAMSGTGNNSDALCHTTVELSDLLKSSVKNLLDIVPEDKFVSIYKTCYQGFERKDDIVSPSLRGSSSEAKKYLSQFKDIIIKSTYKTIEETVFNMNMKFQELEELKLSQLDSNVYWRPPGNALEHLRPFDFISESEKKKELESRIEREQEAVKILKGRLTQKRTKANNLNKQLLTYMEEIKGTVTSKININLK